MASEQELFEPEYSTIMSHSQDREAQPFVTGSIRGELIRFGRFQALPAARLLLCDGRPVKLGSRAFDLLIVLLRGRGRLVTKEEIVRHVWPATVVEESNLRFQMGALRKVLGDARRLIKTIPGRGYLLTTDERVMSAATAAPETDRQIWSGPPRLPGKTVPQRDDSTRSTVVVIDDDADVREAIQGLLRSAGLHVELFASVQAFLEDARPSMPGCLVLDVLLPGQSGLEFQAQLSKAVSAPPVIFISGHADVHMSVRAMKAGAFDFLTKPVRHQELLDAIQRAMTVPPPPMWRPTPDAAS